VLGELRKVNDAGIAIGDEFSSTASGSSAITCPPLQVIASSSDPSFINFGFDINDSGDTVGRLGVGPTVAIFHPFLRHNGTTTDLGTLFPGMSSSVGAAMGINDEGVAVGFSAAAGAIIGPPSVPPTKPRAFIYANGKMVDLNTLLPASCANWTLVVAKDINNRGQIVGAAFVGGFPGGVEHGFLLTPVK
jgi:probable HAF family extracellular repeat protein